LTARKPLGTLAVAESPFVFSDVEEPGSPSPLKPARRLRRRGSDSSAPGGGAESGSPSSSRPTKHNAFDILAVGAQKAKEKKPLKKSEFVEAEAQESDEDDGFGFKKKTEDEKENDSDVDNDKPVEGLVDDALMDEATLAEKLVQEKFK
jgi:mediator of replication checkpoint protein 1